MTLFDLHPHADEALSRWLTSVRANLQAAQADLQARGIHSVSWFRLPHGGHDLLISVAAQCAGHEPLAPGFDAVDSGPPAIRLSATRGADVGPIDAVALRIVTVLPDDASHLEAALLASAARPSQEGMVEEVFRFSRNRAQAFAVCTRAATAARLALRHQTQDRLLRACGVLVIRDQVAEHLLDISATPADG
jgi:hypothetical protein